MVRAPISSFARLEGRPRGGFPDGPYPGPKASGGTNAQTYALCEAAPKQTVLRIRAVHLHLEKIGETNGHVQIEERRK